MNIFLEGLPTGNEQSSSAAAPVPSLTGDLHTSFTSNSTSTSLSPAVDGDGTTGPVNGEHLASQPLTNQPPASRSSTHQPSLTQLYRAINRNVGNPLPNDPDEITELPMPRGRRFWGAKGQWYAKNQYFHMFENGILFRLPYKTPTGRLVGVDRPRAYFTIDAEGKYAFNPHPNLSLPQMIHPPPRYWITDDVDEDRLVPMEPQPDGAWLPTLVAAPKPGQPESDPLGLGPVTDPMPPSSGADYSGPEGVQDVQQQTIQPPQPVEPVEPKRARAKRARMEEQPSQSASEQSSEGKSNSRAVRSYKKSKTTQGKLVDNGLTHTFDSPSNEIPEKLIHGGLIRPKPSYSEDTSEKHIDKGKSKKNETNRSEDTIMKDATEKANATHSGQPGAIEPPTMPMRSNAPQSLGGSGEELTEEEQAFSVAAQQTIDADERHIQASIQLSVHAMNDQPTAEEAENARGGLSKEEHAKNNGISLDKLEENEAKLDAAAAAREKISEEELRRFGIDVDTYYMIRQPKTNLSSGFRMMSASELLRQLRARRPFFARLSNYPEVIMEVASYLPPKDLINLYSVSKDFHDIVEGHLAHTMLSAATTQAPESASVFQFKFYGDLCVTDPVGRSHPLRENETRLVPGPRWLRMVVHREKTIRDILALMAREGHRMPKGMSLSLKKMWLIMDISINRQRVQLLRSPYFTDMDIFNMQLFIVKLDMRFNDPNDGPGEDHMRVLMLGQRGLTPLCKLLKRQIGLTPIEMIKMGIRYAFTVKPEHRGLPLLEIPPEEIGIGHLEGWGKGKIHLFRPDELIIREAVLRRLGLKDHIMGMMLWGYVDPVTGKNLKPTDEEMYMSEDEGEEEYITWEENSDVDSEPMDNEFLKATEGLNIDAL